MKYLFTTLWGFIIIVFIGTACEKGPSAEDQILYQDINPDTTMDYDTIVLFQYPFQYEGSFNYNIDLDQDGTDDFQVSGNTWPGHFDHVGVMWYNDHETRVVALNDQAFIANYDHFGPCCETDLNAGDRINDKLEWANEARLSYSIFDNVLNCSWKGDFLAVKLIKDGNNLFGWIDFDGYEVPTIKDMAVNLTHDKKILAGQKE
jgi:hypothetical protein